MNMKAKIKAKGINLKSDKGITNLPQLHFGGWIDGVNSYLWIGDSNDYCLGTLTGKPFYDLCKRVVVSYELDKQLRKEKGKKNSKEKLK